MTKEEFYSIFKYKGWLYGVVPVYVGDLDDPNGPALMCRYKWLEWWMDIVETLGCSIASFKANINPNYEPLFPIKITGSIKPR